MNTQKKVLWITLICVILQICLFTTPAYADFTVPDISYPEVPSYSTDDFYDHMTDIMDFSDNSALLDYYLNNVAPADDGTWDNYHEHIFNIRTMKSSRYEKYDETFHYLASQEIQLSCRCGELGEVITEQISRDNHGLLEPHQMRNGRCIVCGYVDADSALNGDQKRYYEELLRAIAEGKDPLEDSEGVVVQMLARRLYYDCNADLGQTAKIVRTLRNAPRQYEYLYLLAFFNYNIELNVEEERNVDNSTAFYNLPWSTPSNIIRMWDSSGDTFWNVFFHESGHATELNLWNRKNGEVNGQFVAKAGEVQTALTKDVENRIRKTIRELYGENVPKSDVDAIVNAFINDHEQEYESYTFLGFTLSENVRTPDTNISFSRRLSEMYNKTRDSIEESMKQVPKTNGSMVQDVYGGVTNNKLAGVGVECGHPSVGTDSEGNRLQYWWDNGVQTGNQEAEAWAEFFSAQITGDDDAIRFNKEFFPEATAALQGLADELYEYYVNYYTEIAFGSN